MDNLKHTDLLFIDIETVPQYPNYNDVPDIEKNLWAKKAQYLMHQNDTVESIYQKAGIYAEFGKIICISTAYLTLKNSAYQLHVKSFYDDDEKTVLQNFTSYLNKIHKEKNLGKLHIKIRLKCGSLAIIKTTLHLNYWPTFLVLKHLKMILMGAKWQRYIM
jgi:hypothetical protein